jgi:hypothetical protein
MAPRISVPLSCREIFEDDSGFGGNGNEDDKVGLLGAGAAGANPGAGTDFRTGSGPLSIASLMLAKIFSTRGSADTMPSNHTRPFIAHRSMAGNQLKNHATGRAIHDKVKVKS